jgi:hypothetical protein
MASRCHRRAQRGAVVVVASSAPAPSRRAASGVQSAAAVVVAGALLLSSQPVLAVGIESMDILPASFDKPAALSKYADEAKQKLTDADEVRSPHCRWTAAHYCCAGAEDVTTYVRHASATPCGSCWSHRSPFSTGPVCLPSVKQHLDLPVSKPLPLGVLRYPASWSGELDHFLGGRSLALCGAPSVVLYC